MWPEVLNVLLGVVCLGTVPAGNHWSILLSSESGTGGGHSLTGKVSPLINTDVEISEVVVRVRA